VPLVQRSEQRHTDIGHVQRNQRRNQVWLCATSGALQHDGADAGTPSKRTRRLLYELSAIGLRGTWVVEFARSESAEAADMVSLDCCRRAGPEAVADRTDFAESKMIHPNATTNTPPVTAR
jgi:hypothetical protein